MATFNFVHLTFTALLYTGYFIYPSLISKCTDCSQPPHTSSYYKDVVTALIIKGAVFLIAIITELLVAIQISLKASANSCNKCLRFYQIILLWNAFVFVQIWVGLVLLPACILLIIAPLQTIPVLCAAITGPPLLMAVIAILLRLGNQLDIRNCDCKSNAMVCIHFSRHMVFVILIVALMTLYFYLSRGGTTLSSSKGILFSLFPSIILSMTVWGIKRRFFSGKLNMKGERSRKNRLVTRPMSASAIFLVSFSDLAQGL